MIKKLLSAALAASVLCSSAGAAFTDIPDGPLSTAAETLSIAGILDGMGDGTYRPGDYVTREQFAKIAVCVLGQQDKAAASLSATAFTDVAPDSWARGYIGYVAENGIIAGFPDGSFGGNNVITYAQAVTVLMRCLGYTDADIGFHWPLDYVNKAAALGLNEGVYLSANDYVSRGDLALLVYNALLTDMNNDGAKLITCTGLTLYEDALLYGLNRSDSSMVETSEGSFRLSGAVSGVDGSFGKTGMMFVNRDHELVLFRSDGSDGVEIVVSSCLDNIERGTVDISHSGGIVSIPYSGTVFSDGEKTTARSVIASITTGSRMLLFYDDAGRFSSAVLDSYTMAGPRTVTGDSDQIYDLFGISTQPSVIRRGVSASVSDISRFDIVYYDENTNIVYAYDDKVSGIYEKAEPLKSGVTDVTVSGKTYKLASTEAMNKLGERPGAFAIGDYVTLLLDRNGAVADVVDTSASTGRSLGVLLNSYSRVDQNGNQGYAVKMFLPDGSTMEYTADREYKDGNGNLYEMSFENGIASLKYVSYRVKTGTINKELMSFDGNWLSSDCSVLELVSNPSGGEAVVRKIRFSDIEGTSLSSSQVIHAEISGVMNDVSLLYLRGATKSDYEYGIVTDIDMVIDRDENGNITKRRTTGSYVVLLHGVETSINVQRRVFGSSVIGINSVTNSDYADTVVLGTGRSIEAISGDRIKVGGKVYRTAESYDIYRRTGPNQYALVSFDEAQRLTTTRVELYGDMRVESGGKVRLVIVE